MNISFSSLPAEKNQDRGVHRHQALFPKIAMSNFPGEAEAIALLANDKEHALSNVLIPWIKAGFSIDKCMSGLREIQWPSDKMPSRSALGRRVKGLRTKLEIATNRGRPRKDVPKNQRGKDGHDGLVGLGGGSPDASMRPGFEHIGDASKVGAGKQTYKIE